ncbi:MAG: sigma-70 family RNA polymerase sigma factor [Chthoniobacterales bacterium]|nr:sigma-70 family RNA polymerase sigma factor [Chthoniobacterales bacterium]
MNIPSASPQKVTQLLTSVSEGDQAALTELAPLVYEDLRRLAHRYMQAERADHTLQATALVNEAYLRMADQTKASWQTRAHFFAIAARTMRQILVNYAKSYRAQKRGGGDQKVELEAVALISPAQSQEIIELHEVLAQLAVLDERKARVVEMKYFGGLSYEEIAAVLGVSAITVRRDWEFARLWLYAELRGPGDGAR